MKTNEADPVAFPVECAQVMLSAKFPDEPESEEKKMNEVEKKKKEKQTIQHESPIVREECLHFACLVSNGPAITVLDLKGDLR